MFQRPDSQGGGTSRSKVTGVVLGAWAIGAHVAHVPAEIVETVSWALVGVLGYFLKGQGGSQ